MFVRRPIVAAVSALFDRVRFTVGLRSLALSTFYLLLSTFLSAQDAVPPDLTNPNEGLSAREIQTLQGQPAAAQPAVTGQQLAETPRRLNYGLTVTARGVYDDNVNISSFSNVSDYYIAIEPSLFIGFGGGDSAPGSNSLTLIYRPSAFLFINHSENDTVQHVIRLQANHNFGRLTVALSQDVQILDGPDLNSISDPTGHNANIDVGQRTRHNLFTTQINDSYDLTGKLFLTNSVGLTVDDYPSQFIGSKNIFGNLFINYNYSEKLAIGVGGTGGYNTVEQGSPDQTYEQANVRMSYAATSKTSFSASGGAEFRQFQDTLTGSRGTYISPVFDLTATYRPFDGTTLSLTGNRRIQNSASLGGQDYTSTNVHVAASQRFLRRFTLGLAVGYENSMYFSTIQGLNASRDDNYYYVQPTVDVTITRFWVAGGYYLYRKNSSSLSLFGFDDNQVGVRSSITF
jgi:hypothetical protein